MFNMNLGNLVTYLSVNDTRFNRVLTRAEGRIQRTATKFDRLGRSMTMSITAPLTAFAALSLRAFATFDDAITQSTAIMSDVSAETRREMERTALSMSRDSITTARELAQSYYFLASAGLKVHQSIATLPAVEKFAVAGMFNMARASSLLMDAQSALGLRVADTNQNMLNAVRVSDVLVRANTLANASVEQFASALTNKAAAAIRLLNKDMEEGVAVLAVFADQGIKDVEAGEKLYIVMRDLQKSVLKAGENWKKMGLSVFDARGKMRPMADIIAQMEKRFASMSDQQKKATFSMLGFQDRSLIAIQTLMGTSQRIREYEKSLRAATGFTERVAAKQLASFSAQMKILWNNIVAASIGIGRMLVPAVQKMNVWIRSGLNYWEGLTESMRKTVLAAFALAAALGPGLFIMSKLLLLLGPMAAGLRIIGNFAIWAFTALKVGGIVALIPLIKIIAVVALVGLAIWGLIQLIGGSEGLAAAWGTVTSAVSKFAKRSIGFLANFKHNVKALLKWLPENWLAVVRDLATVWIIYQQNMISNMGVVLKTIMRLYVAFQGWMLSMFTKLFQGDFNQAIAKGLKRAADTIWKWVQEIASWDLLTNLLLGRGIVPESLTNLGRQLGKDFTKGMEETNFLKTAKNIIKEGASEMVSPLKGFQSSLKDLPDFKFDTSLFQSSTKAAKQMEKTSQALEKIAAPVQKAVEAQAPEKAVAAGISMSAASFREVNLRRFSLDTPSASFRPEFNRVEAPGVENKLDELIQVEKQRMVAVLG